MIAIIDYDAGNIKSVEKAFLSLGQETAVTRDPDVILSADGVILPGVGAFGVAMGQLKAYGLIPVIERCVGEGKPFLGICLGLQLLFEGSEESPGTRGLGLLKGKVLRFPEGNGLRIPHIGWNDLKFPHPGRLFRGIPEGAYVYFVHSYYLQAEDERMVTASADYGVCFHVSVEQGNLFACQFHPEKSSDVGMRILRNFTEIVREK